MLLSMRRRMVRGECFLARVGQNHIYTVNVRYFWQENHQIYSYIRCLYTVLADPFLNMRRRMVRGECFSARGAE